VCEVTPTGNTLVNLQQMFAQQAVHIVLSLPLNCSSRECIFINTFPIEKCTIVFKNSFLLKQDPNDSKDLLYQSIIDYYIECPLAINNIYLVELVCKYQKNGTRIFKRKKKQM
jgi:hypothetical protein